MKTMREVKAAAVKFGGTVADCSSGRWCCHQIEAPDGKQWSCAGIVTIKLEWLRGDAKYKADAITDAIDRIQHGTEDIYEE